MLPKLHETDLCEAPFSCTDPALWPARSGPDRLVGLGGRDPLHGQAARWKWRQPDSSAEHCQGGFGRVPYEVW